MEFQRATAEFIRSFLRFTGISNSLYTRELLDTLRQFDKVPCVFFNACTYTINKFKIRWNNFEVLTKPLDDHLIQRFWSSSLQWETS